jgi:pectinesterase
VVFINCELGKHIRPEGWHNWDKVANESTAFYAEYRNNGEGAATARRVKWSHQLTDEQAAEYTLEKIFKTWKPVK